MNTTYLRTLVPALVQTRTEYEIFYEVKANLTRNQLRLLAQAGVSRIQPGLESLSSHVLGLMRKGVRAAQNVNLLRWARYYGIDVAWNLLWGFPGETVEDYSEQARIMPHLFHLQPPSSADRIWVERFSPLYMQATPAPGTPERSYRYVYPAGVDLRRVAYFFEYELPGCLPDSAYTGVAQAVRDWADGWKADPTPALTYRSAPGFLQIQDTRPGQPDGTYTFRDTLADIYLACTDAPTTAVAIGRKVGHSLSTQTIQGLLGEFQQRGLMFLDRSLAVALAIPAVRGR
jgi:ribosomal peptide maturation radical SAM protein 1